MPNAQRGVVQPPNLGTFSSNRAANGFSPLTRQMSTVKPANADIRDGNPGGSSDLTRQPSQVQGSNHRFQVDNVGNSQINNFPVQPGQGAVPVNPFLASGPGLARAMPIADEAKAR